MNMKRLLLLTLLSGFLLSLASCSGGNKVVSNGFIQKRKHTKGFYFDIVSNQRKSDKKLLVAKEDATSHSDSTHPNKQLEIKESYTFSASHVKEGSLEMEKRHFELGTRPNISTQTSSEKTDLALVKSKIFEEANSFKLSNYPDSDDADLPFKASVTFFCGILGWFFLVAAILVPIILSQTWLIGLIILGVSMIFELIAFFVGQNIEGAVKAGDIGFDLAKYYWWFMGSVLTISLSSLIFIF
ncbi:MAG: hypothetical protein NWS53_02185 [Salibacteraceae bacterium]|jgi:hypothetical protein|nr:hypothetical protein [Salibacteraceae bacterium]